MTTDMGPPPPRNPNPSTMSDATTSSEPQTTAVDEPLTSRSLEAPMGPPPPQNPTTPKPDQRESLNHASQDRRADFVKNKSEPIVNATESSAAKNDADGKQEQRPNVAVPYAIPPWSEPPCHHYFLEVLKDGSIIDQFDVHEKGAYMFGRTDLCDFMLEHPTISRFHAVLQFKGNGEAFLYDLGSTHGTSVNKNQVKKKVYIELHVGDMIRFGQSSRLYIFQGPSELMLPEHDLKSIRNAKMREEMQDMEASLLRAKVEASFADGISWGMQEDAIEEAEDDVDEITWQTYKGQLTEKQEKTRDKVVKRLEKIANMKKEISAIRAKDISQGGLTQGQQTQIARNEQRISQIMEELENLEETLNESIRESLGARTGVMSRGKKKGATEEEDEGYFSEDDDFYDRTKKPPGQKDGENQSIETADSLLDKKESIIKEMEEKKLLLSEDDRMATKYEAETEAGDTLDSYMSGLSSQLELDKVERLQKELSTLQSELDRILFLLNIADPMGEAAQKRESKSRLPKPSPFKSPNITVAKQSLSEQNKKCGSESLASASVQKPGATDTPAESSEKPEADNFVADAADEKPTVYRVVKPQWLGAVEDMEAKETQSQEASVNTLEADQFVDYKDRKKILGNPDTAQENMNSGIENAAPGLIIRKPKQVEKSSVVEVKDSEKMTDASVEAKIRAEDAVALLLKHKRGYCGADADGGGDVSSGNQSGNDKKRAKRVLGPERPSFLDGESDFQSWVPPEGQSGDGRTSLNDRYGY